MGPIGCLKTSRTNYQSVPRKIPEEHRSHSCFGRSLTSCIGRALFLFSFCGRWLWHATKLPDLPYADVCCYILCVFIFINMKIQSLTLVERILHPLIPLATEAWAAICVLSALMQYGVNSVRRREKRKVSIMTTGVCALTSIAFVAKIWVFWSVSN